MTKRFVIIDVHDKNDIELLERFYNEVFIKDFTDVNEAESLNNIISQSDRSYKSSGFNTYIVIATDIMGTPIGGGIADYFYDSNSVFIEYVSVKETHRSKGIGKDIVNFIIKYHSMRVNNKVLDYIFWETENPDLCECYNIGVIAKKRWKFFHNLGAKRVDMKYIQPALEEGKSPVYHLDLCCVVVNSELPRQYIEYNRVLQALFYFHKYAFNTSLEDKNIAYEQMIECLNDDIILLVEHGVTKYGFPANYS